MHALLINTLVLLIHVRAILMITLACTLYANAVISAMPRNCYNCNKDLARCWHGKCRRCKWAKYCSTSCQTKDWPLHKQWCRIACQPGNPVRQQGFATVEVSSQRCESLMVEYMFQLLQEQHSHSLAVGGFGNSSLCWLQLTSLCELAHRHT